MSDISSGETPRRFLANVPITAIIVGIVLIASAIFLALSITESREQRRVANTFERHTYEVLLETRELLTALKNAETGNRGYILTAQPRFLGPFDQGMADAPRELARLKAMTKDNAVQQADIVRLARLVGLRLGGLQRGVDLVRGETAPLQSIWSRTGLAKSRWTRRVPYWPTSTKPKQHCLNSDQHKIATC